ncbi:YdcH family protein [Rhizobium sp. SG2393]|uniref:YdcH family protein n=1 Tax=Rhizobium sp. SG2393 TaxID=3276279 RepID=UPI00366DF493
MTIEAHLATLERKHGALERELNEALAHPSSDDREIATLKRRKLRIKDEIEKIRSSVH